MSTVKVQNWDNTMTTVPTRALITESFKNWRTMYAIGGRRLQRSVMLDVHAVRLLTPALLERFPAMAEVRQRIAAGDVVVTDLLVDDAAERPTNLGIYRVYLTEYLRQHPRTNQEMTCMVRQLQVADDGLPLELYLFLQDTGWPNFELTASSIIEHVYATLPQFGLRPFQRPMSMDTGDPPLNATTQPFGDKFAA